MNDTRKALAWLASLVALVWAVSAYAGGNAPPPYNAGQVQLATVNALGNVGRTEGCSGIDYSTTTSDLVALGAGTPIRTFCGGALGLENELSQATVFPRIREIVVTAPGDAFIAHGAICVRLGPATDGGPPPGNPDGAPALTCPNTDSAGVTGGCYLTAEHTSCAFMLRPLTSGCTDYASCHIPLWAKASSNQVAGAVAVTWAW